MYTRIIVLLIALVVFVAPVAAFKAGSKSGMLQKRGEKAAMGSGGSVGSGGMNGTGVRMRDPLPDVKKNREEIRTKWSDFKDEFGNLRQFF